ncbi:MAG: DUF2853 family protein [Saprospiraceae bacterium]|nr:DUF2853 family protein [Saprospiraceae bacterium]
MSVLTKESKKTKLSKRSLSDQALIDIELFKNIAESLGPSIYLKEASNFDFTEVELKRIKDNFLIQKLKLKESKDLDIKFETATQEFINSNFKRERVYFYYLLVKRFNKEKVFQNQSTEEVSDKNELNRIIGSFKKAEKLRKKKNEDILTDFGQRFIENQKDLDQDIFEIVDKNFSSLY